MEIEASIVFTGGWSNQGNRMREKDFSVTVTVRQEQEVLVCGCLIVRLGLMIFYCEF